MLRRYAVGLAITIAVLGVVPATCPAFAKGGDTDDVTVSNPKDGTYKGRWNRDPYTEKHTKKKPSSGTGESGEKKTLTKIVLKKPDNTQRKVAIEVMCREAMAAGISCEYTPPKKNGRAPGRLMLDLDAVARTLLTRIQLPDPTPQIGPDPKVNEWKMAAVGYPLWLWTAGPHTVTDRVRAYGVTFTLRATWVSSHFDMGDGHSVTCITAQPYTKAVKPGATSPTCGYTYLTSSLPKGNYTVTATTNWRITWSALGMSGSMPGSFSGTRSLPVGELNALVVK